MSDQINVGDVVVVAFDACCSNPRAHLGRIFRVAKFTGSTICTTCGASLVNRAAAADGSIGYAVARLKRLPPLTELESERTNKEDIREPA